MQFSRDARKLVANLLSSFEFENCAAASLFKRRATWIRISGLVARLIWREILVIYLRFLSKIVLMDIQIK